MKFSEKYRVEKDVNDNWFDPILTYDTRLFIDPFEVFKNEKDFFIGAHDKIIRFFNETLKIIAKSSGQKNNLFYKKSRQLLLFPEVSEIGLGYTQESTSGAGSGSEFADIMFDSIWIAIKKGVSKIEHFEELEIFNVGIGPDRISDITANILKKELILYTESICKKHKVAMREYQIRNSDFNFKYLRWERNRYLLPEGLENKPIILVPENYLDELPEINHGDFWDYLISNKAEELRNNFNFEISRSVDKKTIVEIAKSKPEYVEEYISRKDSLSDSSPYDFRKDKSNLVKWYEEGANYVEKNPISINTPSDDSEFLDIVELILEKFKKYVESIGNKLLWNDDNTQRKEDAAQRTFVGIGRSYAENNNIDISRESDLGRGPVDFKFSSGYKKRCLIEVKKANNTKYFRNLKKQLPIYMQAEDVDNGYYVIIRYSKKDDVRIKKTQQIIKELNEEGLNIKWIVVNAEKLPSASRA